MHHCTILYSKDFTERPCQPRVNYNIFLIILLKITLLMMHLCHFLNMECILMPVFCIFFH